MKKTLVLGASEKTDRFSNRAIRKLIQHGHPVVAVGARSAKVGDVEIIAAASPAELPVFEGVDTVTLYLSPENQKVYYSYILALKPKRIVFNPGTENEDLEAFAQKQGIKTIEYCTLILLDQGEY